MNWVFRLRNWLLDERAIVVALSTTIADNVAAAFEVLGMLFMPLVPASLTALSIYFALTLDGVKWPLWAAVLIAVLIVVSLESLGIASAKTAMRLYRAWQDGISQRREFLAVVVSTGLYVGLVFLINVFGAGLPTELRWIAYVSPVLAVALYVVIGLNSDLQQRRDELAQVKALSVKVETDIKLAELEDHKARLEMQRVQEARLFEQKLEAKRLQMEARFQSQGVGVMSHSQRLQQAKALLHQNPDISGAEVGRRLGMSERTGQALIAELRG